MECAYYFDFCRLCLGFETGTAKPASELSMPRDRVKRSDLSLLNHCSWPKCEQPGGSGQPYYRHGISASVGRPFEID